MYSTSLEKAIADSLLFHRQKSCSVTVQTRLWPPGKDKFPLPSAC